MLWSKAIGAGGVAGGIQLVDTFSKTSAVEDVEGGGAELFFDEYNLFFGSQLGWRNTGYAAGDLLIVFAYFNALNGGTSGTTLTNDNGGWTELFDVSYDVSGRAVHAGCWYKTAVTSETDFTITCSEEPNQAAGRLLVFRGVDTSSPFDAVYQEASGTGASPDLPSITPTTDGAVLIGAAGMTDSSSTFGSFSISGGSYDISDNTTSFTSSFDSEYHILNRIVVDTWYGGAWDESAWTVTGKTPDNWVTHSLALKPA